jgi:hypothetical protein
MNRRIKGGEYIAAPDRRGTDVSGCFSEVFHIRGQAGVHRIGPAQPLKPGRYVRVFQVGMIAAARADELKRVVMAAFHPAVHDAGRLAPETRRSAVTRLAEKGGHLGIVVINAQPGVTNVLLAARCRNRIHCLRRPNARGGVRVWKAHSIFLPGMPLALPGSGAALRALNLQEGIRASPVHYAWHRARAWAGCMAPRPYLGPVARCGEAGHREALYSPVWSSTSASGAFFFTDSIPLSADCRRS